MWKRRNLFFVVMCAVMAWSPDIIITDGFAASSLQGAASKKTNNAYKFRSASIKATPSTNYFASEIVKANEQRMAIAPFYNGPKAKKNTNYSKNPTYRDGKDGKDGRDGQDGYQVKLGVENDAIWWWWVNKDETYHSIPEKLIDFINLQGPQGPKGDTGETGPQGPQGEQGIQGPKGDKGDKGDAGEPGTPGAKGDTGETGPQGPKGDTGETGPQGPQGEQGIQGPKGDKGDKGDTGEPGTPGAKGDTGETGPYFIPTVDENGYISWTNTGELENPTTQNIKGPQGPAGNDGKTPTVRCNTTLNNFEYSYNNENWYTIDGSKCMGDSGNDGTPGADGKTPQIQCNGTSKKFEYRYNNNDSWQEIPDSKCVGTDGQDGRDGTDGAPGPYFIPTVDENGYISWTNTGELENPTTQNIKGPQGPAGNDGKTPTVRCNTTSNNFEYSYNNENWYTIDGSKCIGDSGTDGAPGTDGKTPQIQCNPSTEHFEIRYNNDDEWNDIGGNCVATNGTNGITPQIRCNTSSEHFEASYDAGQNWTDINGDCVSADGTNGINAPLPIFKCTQNNNNQYVLVYTYDNGATWLEVENSQCIGEQGPQGEQGIQGPAGLSPTLHCFDNTWYYIVSENPNTSSSAGWTSMNVPCTTTPRFACHDDGSGAATLLYTFDANTPLPGQSGYNSNLWQNATNGSSACQRGIPPQIRCNSTSEHFEVSYDNGSEGSWIDVGGDCVTADGDDGGYYQPTITTNQDNTYTLSWTASGDNMSSVSSTTLSCNCTTTCDCKEQIDQLTKQIENAVADITCNKDNQLVITYISGATKTVPNMVCCTECSASVTPKVECNQDKTLGYVIHVNGVPTNIQCCTTPTTLYGKCECKGNTSCVCQLQGSPNHGTNYSTLSECQNSCIKVTESNCEQ